jgi:hypothetical protein
MKQMLMANYWTWLQSLQKPQFYHPLFSRLSTPHSIEESTKHFFFTLAVLKASTPW